MSVIKNNNNYVNMYCLEYLIYYSRMYIIYTAKLYSVREHCYGNVYGMFSNGLEYIIMKVFGIIL